MIDIKEIIAGGREKISFCLTPEQISKYKLSKYQITELIKATGEIEPYLLKGQTIEDEYLEFTIINVIKGVNCCPELSKDDIDLLCSFDDQDIILVVINLDVSKQKEAIFILDSLSKSNSAELRRIKIPIALQILEKDPSEYRSTLKKIEEIYLTSNIPIVGKLFLVFKELHPNFLGTENTKIKDESFGNIPSLKIATQSERNHIIFADLLRCAIESNSRNLRDYLKIIEEGNKLYENVLNNNVKLEEMNKNDFETLSKYRDILNTLYNVTANGKRKEEKRETSDDLLKDLIELDALFNNDPIKLNLPDRIVRTFGYYAGIRTFEQAKRMMQERKETAHEKNIKTAKSGKVELKKGDFVKGIQDTKYFSDMLQRGILAKDYLGGNATHDATPLDTDVEKVIEEKETFRKTLSTLTTANLFSNGNVVGKSLGKILLVFSGDNFVETRDEHNNINQENIDLLKNDSSKKEVFHNSGTAYGIRTGIGSTNIKYIIADRYVDKLGLEIALNGFYIPVVDNDGNVIYTKEMYDEFRSKMHGLSYYEEDEFILDESAKNSGTTQIKELVDKNEQNSKNKRSKILKALEEAVKAV